MADAGTGTAPRPLRRDAERNRARILDAAREVFRHRGFDATLDDIAAQTGLGVATVYRRFPDKDHLIEAMFAQRLHDIRRWPSRPSTSRSRGGPWSDSSSAPPS